MRIEEDIKLGFKDVLIRPKRSILKSRSQVNLARCFSFKYSASIWSGIPIIAANMDTIGTFEMVKSLSKFNILTAVHKYYSFEEWKNFVCLSSKEILNHVIVSIGTSNIDFLKIKKIFLLSSELKYICIDVANGYSEHIVSFLKLVRDYFPDKIICAGNVVTGEMVEELILSGADIVKVGIGPGSVCTTRVKTGVGYPQLSAIIECADAAHGLNGQIISDGGCTVSGDIAKAFGGGADFVMLGGMLSGHKECSGDIIEEKSKKYMIFYGMSSVSAMQRYEGKIAGYRASEGKTVKIPFRGSVDSTIRDILGGLRSSCTYVGAEKLKELTKRTTFIRVTEQENCIFNAFKE
ncbi:GMP reductase [Buchnera aphidicola]|uniref:GMP reductase n=1 Tax=Buchnera aphidicola subsp. Acyrthosiphon pisum (strain Tuc7) TaxID=561501 RepID=GUAC_BUCAT|nr:GMP reductase [Buchnera aphidicola]B8D7A8.1 RecName: Full=GMP reductase; AltName: Full=Guanosine 5'-monophosphate oxidoreductase; Short=Guanosine monophosphate reductase [Buchnera aphidicola str. Tuc7 (Acyrthosiphon pisum)]ACL30023.1 guanosine 5'-monophosphate oxidoreductase [Buchnera aphidicola str. Tuc7 (Acyrthosiphon pisum)]ADP66028.1 guanosine 5'-monophosphate oxidoreductase [Buchnera aphidicola str. LL01 (Acyrthosiphon pisum)]ADP66600.1 guanosine 5'-monophosphate oxidoreductase [Buchner